MKTKLTSLLLVLASVCFAGDPAIAISTVKGQTTGQKGVSLAVYVKSYDVTITTYFVSTSWSDSRGKHVETAEVPRNDAETPMGTYIPFDAPGALDFGDVRDWTVTVSGAAGVRTNSVDVRDGGGR